MPMGRRLVVAVIAWAARRLRRIRGEVGNGEVSEADHVVLLWARPQRNRAGRRAAWRARARVVPPEVAKRVPPRHGWPDDTRSPAVRVYLLLSRSAGLFRPVVPVL